MNAVKPKQPDGRSAASTAALVLIPGMLNDRSIWDEVIAGVRRQLGDKVHVLVADVITQVSIADMARDAWRQLADVPAQTPCFVAGFSMGGYVALEMLSHPLRPIREAWLISTSGLPESPNSAPMREKAIASFEKDFEKAIQATARWGPSRRSPRRSSRSSAPCASSARRWPFARHAPSCSAAICARHSGPWTCRCMCCVAKRIGSRRPTFPRNCP